LLSLAAVTLGIAVTTAVGTIALDVGDRVGRELRSFGANISLSPAADGLAVTLGGVDYRPAGAGGFLDETDLVKLKKLFWRNNIMAFAPFLDMRGKVGDRAVVMVGSWFDRDLTVDKSETFRTGLRRLHPTWKVQGQWPDDSALSSCLVGRRLAAALHVSPGETLSVDLAPTSSATGKLTVRGILEAGGDEDDWIFVPLARVQELTGLDGKFRRAEISALIKPEDDFARSDVTKLSGQEFDRWYCTPYVSAICYQIQQAMPGAEARPVYRVAETEGRILHGVGALMALLAMAAMITSALAVASMMFATVLERRAEIGLYKSLGAGDGRVAAIFLLEALVVGLCGGLAGYFAGSLMARRLGTLVFGLPAEFHWVILPAALALALLVTVAGSAMPLARGLKLAPVAAMRNE
jgi:putative ABC transport system permease protein